MNNEQAQPIVNSKRKFVIGGIALIAISVLLVIGGCVGGLVSGCLVAVPGLLGINLLVTAYKSAAPRA